MLDLIFENPALTAEIATVVVSVMAVGILATVAIVVKKGV